MGLNKAKAEELDWITIGWNSIIFKIPKGYNHQLVKETKVLIEQAKKEGREGVIREIEKKMEVHRVVKWVMDNDKDYEGEVMVIKKKEWEGFKHGKFKKSKTKIC